MTSKIRKAIISKFGDPSNISVVSADIPLPSANEAQVEVIYAGFSGADTAMRMGRYPMQKGAPLTPGYCFAGRVKANGSGCTKFRPGDIVTSLTTYDSDAELINVPEKYLIPILDGVDFQDVAALTLDWTTAYGMVFRAAKVSQGQRVFIHGVSGAVGYALLVLCQHRGATVYGTASERNHAELRELGVTPFTYKNKRWVAVMQSLGGVHAAFDPLGFESWDESYSILSTKESSILVGYGGNLPSLVGGPGRSPYLFILKLMARNLMFWSSKRTNFFYVNKDDANFVSDLLALMDLVKTKKIQIRIKQVWGLEDIRKAHEAWGTAPGMGSVVIRVKKE